MVIENVYMEELREELRWRKANEERVIERGGNMYEQLEARLRKRDGVLAEDIVIYGIRTIKEMDSRRRRASARSAWSSGRRPRPRPTSASPATIRAPRSATSGRAAGCETT